ncbi:hypothetical protein E1B28_011752 [Marasmius oreades]|uniref:F-box domain-containing protein n=1 Tax=Marasmius oreades TaxID=181124 RepID=A0A9P7RUQ8_9AGAR|nr:uncharacterized protein E1B28_011752 [Marasmius oreades]KAG7090144.1 hypothetical protein E1B28_011752 [Marasmius oreades]
MFSITSEYPRKLFVVLFVPLAPYKLSSDLLVIDMESGEAQVVPDSDYRAIQERLDTQKVFPTGYLTRPAINTIPVEILSQIFWYFQPEAHVCLLPDIPPLALFIGVCRHWRAVALNTPSLWSTIVLNNPKRIHLTMVHQWLERSTSCPLTLSLTLDNYEVLRWNTAERILSIFTQYLHRWKSIFLSFTNFPIHSRSPLLQLPISRTAAPLLEKVNIRNRRSFTPEANERFWKAIGAYDSVRHVIRIEASEDPKLSLPNLLGAPWANLILLTAQFAVDDACMDFLSGCQALEGLKILSLVRTSASLHPRSRIRLPSLHTLSYSSSEPFGLPSLLDQLELPALTSLTLNEWHCGHSWIDMLESSACQLKTMRISEQPSAEADIPDLLLSSSLQYLEEFRGYMRFSPAGSIIQALTWKSGTRSLPSLRRLDLTIGTFEDGLLSAMLTSRLDHFCCALQQVSLNLRLARKWGDISTDFGFVKDLSVDGLDFSYR